MIKLGKLKKLKKLKLGKYRIRYDHKVGSKYSDYANNKKDAVDKIRKTLERYPYIKASLEVYNKEGIGYKSHSSYKWRYNRKTKRHRLVQV